MGLGHHMDRSKMVPIEFGEGVITLADGTQPAYEHLTAGESPKGYATLTFDYLPTEDGEHTRIVIDRGSEISLSGTLYVSADPLPPGDIERLPGVRAEPLRIASVPYLEQIERDCAAMDAGDWPHDGTAPPPGGSVAAVGERSTLH
jgi:hypothetical protein